MYKKTYTFHQYLELQRRKELSITEKFLATPEYEKAFVFFTGIVFYARDIYASTGSLSGLDKFGIKVLGYGRKIGYWICVIMCIKEIIQSVLSGTEIKDLAKIIIKYFIVVAALWWVPSLFEGIPDYFN